ncbi:hypothetical protein VW35_05670 [Devosia soli]|uniref:Uncharacterized protein n=1 Tax=Devosia soli TaxID=361041 RepID=A0A0F5LC35_9HYPH|nr:hypothetical protein [Devosia soli]KKB79956.1 hypothetical protein VW35_05670 [Devosia soli]
MPIWMRRLLIAAGGVLGAIGVGTAAMASHGEDVRNLTAISAMALAHAPVLLLLALAGRGRVITIAGLVLAGGCGVFVADLAMRQWLSSSLFPGAAPIGGGALILGWVGIALSAASKNLVHD